MTPTIFYINLDHRKDRKEHLQNELNKLDISMNVIRIPAVRDNIGAIGCNRSHLKALQKFIDSDATTAIILEDDFTFNDKMLDLFKEYLKHPPEFDVFLLTANLREYDPHEIGDFIKVRRSFTTAGYWITKPMAQKLYHLWNISLQAHLMSSQKPDPRHCIDVCWWYLMEQFNFIAMNPLIGQIGYQYANFSDIEKRETAYGC